MIPQIFNYAVLQDVIKVDFFCWRKLNLSVQKFANRKHNCLVLREKNTADPHPGCKSPQFCSHKNSVPSKCSHKSGANCICSQGNVNNDTTSSVFVVGFPEEIEVGCVLPKISALQYRFNE